MTDKRIQWLVLAAGIAIAATGCAGDVGARDPRPTVLDSLSTADQHDDAAGDVRENDESPLAGLDEWGTEEPEEGLTPIPASSEGPAQNWPIPEPPEEIYEPTEEGAEALIQHWFDVRHYARITGDTGPWRDVSHANCMMCEGHFSQVEDSHPKVWFVEEEPDLVIYSYVQIESDDAASGLFAHRSGSFEAYHEGALDAEDPGGRDSGFGIGFVFESGHWQVSDLSYLGDYDESSGEGWESGDD